MPRALKRAPMPEPLRSSAPRLRPAAAILIAVLCPTCAGPLPQRWELVSLPVECVGFPVEARVKYLEGHPGLSRRLKDEVLQGRLVPGMTAAEVTALTGEPARRVELPPEGETAGPLEEWLYPEWSKVLGGPWAPAIVYVRGGVVVDFIPVEPSGARKWAPVRRESGPSGPRVPEPVRRARPGVPGILR